MAVGAPGNSDALTEMGGRLPPAATESLRVHSYPNPSTTTWPDDWQLQPLPLSTAGEAVKLQGSVTDTVTGPMESSIPAFDTTTSYWAVPPCTNPPPGV